MHNWLLTKMLLLLTNPKLSKDIFVACDESSSIKNSNKLQFLLHSF